MSEAKSVINRGKRSYTLRPGVDGAKRLLEPGKSIECLDDKEFKLLVGYHDIADVDAIAPQMTKRTEALKKQLADVEAENAKLRAAKPQPEPVHEKVKEEVKLVAHPHKRK